MRVTRTIQAGLRRRTQKQRRMRDKEKTLPVVMQNRSIWTTFKSTYLEADCSVHQNASVESGSAFRCIKFHWNMIPFPCFLDHHLITVFLSILPSKSLNEFAFPQTLLEASEQTIKAHCLLFGTWIYPSDFVFKIISYLSGIFHSVLWKQRHLVCH